MPRNHTSPACTPRSLTALFTIAVLKGWHKAVVFEKTGLVTGDTKKHSSTRNSHPGWFRVGSRRADLPTGKESHTKFRIFHSAAKAKKPGKECCLHQKRTNVYQESARQIQVRQRDEWSGSGKLFKSFGKHTIFTTKSTKMLKFVDFRTISKFFLSGSEKILQLFL